MHVMLGRGVHHSKAHLTSPPRPRLAAAMHEVFTNTPSTVTRANVSGERKRKMLVAIAFAKSRRKGS